MNVAKLPFSNFLVVGSTIILLLPRIVRALWVIRHNILYVPTINSVATWLHIFRTYKSANTIFLASSNNCQEGVLSSWWWTFRWSKIKSHSILYLLIHACVSVCKLWETCAHISDGRRIYIFNCYNSLGPYRSMATTPYKTKMLCHRRARGFTYYGRVTRLPKYTINNILLRRKDETEPCHVINHIRNLCQVYRYTRFFAIHTQAKRVQSEKLFSFTTSALRNIENKCMWHCR